MIQSNPTSVSSPIDYAVDSDDRITDVNEAFLTFGRANGWTGLDRDRVIGMEIWDFITDSGMRNIYRTVMREVRDRRITITLPFRCDSPDCRRYMALAISPGFEGGLLFHVETKVEEPRAEQPILRGDVARTGEFVRMCSVCKRVALNDGSWVDVERAIVALGLPAEDKWPQISHGLCAVCLEEAQQALLKELGP